MKAIKYFISIVIYTFLFYSCGNGNHSESSSNSASLKKCNGEQLYIKYKFGSDDEVIIDEERMEDMGFISQSDGGYAYSSMTAGWGESGIGGSLVLSYGNGILSAGEYSIPDGEREDRGFLLNLDENGRRGNFVPSTGQLIIEHFDYIETNRSDNSQKDYAKGKFIGQFKNIIDFGNETLYPITLEFCLCGEWEKFN